MYLASAHFILISFRRRVINKANALNTSRAGRAVNTKFVYGCSGRRARRRLVTFREPELEVLMQSQSFVTSRAVLSA